MLTQPTPASTWPEELVPRDGILVASGYAVRISVWRGRLRVDDGIGRDRRSVLLHRATARLKRLIVLGHTGSISLEAIRWLAEVKAAFVQVDSDGRVLAANGPLGTDRPSLRRAQARALGSDIGLEIARRLVLQKIAGQRANMGGLIVHGLDAQRVTAEIDRYARAANDASAANELRTCEGMAASAYWAVWSDVAVTFARRDQAKIPAHWRTFGVRSSPLTGGPRLAVNPANALLSYLYAILETETTIACRVVGMDAGLGIFHVDQDNRESLAADLMEPARPLIDRYLLELLDRRTFAASDFHETSAGVCRLTSSLARQLWSVAPSLTLQAGRIAEDVAGQLDPATARTPVTGRHRQEARPYGRLRLRAGRAKPMRKACLECGSALVGRQTICDRCRPQRRREGDARFIGSGPRRLAELRAIGADPTKTAGALEKTRQSRIRRYQEQIAWDKEHPEGMDPTWFRARILPQIQRIPIRRLSETTGLSLRYCSLIRRGERVPHPRWWVAFIETEET